jgi:hypothetical protein
MVNSFRLWTDKENGDQSRSKESQSFVGFSSRPRPDQLHAGSQADNSISVNIHREWMRG